MWACGERGMHVCGRGDPCGGRGGVHVVERGMHVVDREDAINRSINQSNFFVTCQEQPAHACAHVVDGGPMHV